MSGDEERNRILGFPVPARRPEPRDQAEATARSAEAAAENVSAEEADQRVLGFPVSWLRGAGFGWIADVARRGRD